MSRPTTDLASILSASILSIAGASVVAACGPRQVRVEVAVEDGEAVRMFATNRIDHDEADRIRGLYGEGEMRSREGRTEFKAAFPDRLPSEIGNRNGLTSVGSPFGTSHLYWESFHSSRDHWGDLSRRMAGGELWVRLFGRWAELRIEDPSKREEFRSVLEAEYLPLARDLMLAWSSMIATSQAHRVDAGVRDGDAAGSLSDDERFRRGVFLPFVLMLGERGILDGDEVQRFMLLAAGTSPDERRRDWSYDSLIGPAMLRQIRRFSPSAETPTFAEMLAWGVSFYFYANNSQRHRDLLLASGALTPEERVRLEQGRSIRMPSAFGVRLGGGSKPTEAEVALKTPVEPYLTNGVWDPDRSEVDFRAIIPEGVDRVSLYPAIFHAAWAVPDRDRQESCFGEVILQGEDLATFCGWHQTLDESELQRLTEALERLELEGDRTSVVEVIRELGVGGLPDSLVRWMDEAA